jgi:hypothetical protein
MPSSLYGLMTQTNTTPQKKEVPKKEGRAVSAYLLAASRCNRPGSQLNVRVEADFRFVPIQLAEGRPLAEQLGIDPDRPDSFAFVANGQADVKFEAVLRIARELPRWRWTWVFHFIPRVIRT